MWTTDKGIRFELSPWRARRVIAQAKEIAKRRREGQARLPGGVMHDLQRMARFARPVKNMVHNPTGSQVRVFEAQLPDGVFRMMTQSRPGREAVLGVAFRAVEGELEQETAIRNGEITIHWKKGDPVPLASVVALKSVSKTDGLDSQGVYILFRRYGGEWHHKYIGVADDSSLRDRLLTRKEYARQHNDLKNLWVIWGSVEPSNKESILTAEHAIIRTLEPTNAPNYPKKLTNRSSIRLFKSPNGLRVTRVLPQCLLNPNRAQTTNPYYNKDKNILMVPAKGEYELVIR